MGDVRKLKLVRVAAGLDARAWRAALADVDWRARACALKQSDGASVHAADLTVDGLAVPVVVKTRRLGDVGDRVKFMLGQGRGRRQWRGAALLMKGGVDVAEPLALAQAEIDGVVSELLVLRRVEGPTLLHVMRDARLGIVGFRSQRAVAESVGRLVGSLNRAGLRNRDPKPSNVLIAGVLDEGELRPVFVDSVAISRRWFGGEPVASTLAKLIIEPMGCHVAPSRTMRLRAVLACTSVTLGQFELPARDQRRVAWAIWRQVERIVAAHGDPTPKDNPLGP